MRRLRVKEIAAEQGINMTQLSRIANLNYKTVKAIYDDPTKNVYYDTLAKIAEVLHVRVEDLFEEV